MAVKLRLSLETQEAEKALADVAAEMKRVDKASQGVASSGTAMMQTMRSGGKTVENVTETMRDGVSTAKSLAGGFEALSTAVTIAVTAYVSYKAACIAVEVAQWGVKKAVDATRLSIEAAGKGIVSLGDRFAQTEHPILAHYASAEFAAKAFAKQLTGIGAVLTGAELAFKSYMAVADATGRRLEKVGDLFVFSADATEDQVVAFQALEAEAKAMGRTLDAQLRISGKSYEDFGLSFSTNGDRLRKATAGLFDEIKKPFSDVIAMTSQWWQESNILATVWEAIDRDITQRLDPLVENIGLAQKGVRSMRAAVLEYIEAGAGDAYQRELELMEEQAKVTERLAELHERNAGQFAFLRGVNEQRERAVELEKELAKFKGQEPIGGNNAVTDTAALKEILSLRRQLQEDAGKAAGAGMFDEAAQKLYLEKLNILDAREQAIEQRRKAAHAEGIRRIWKEAEEKEKAEREEVHKAVEQSRKEWEERRKLREDALADEAKAREKLIMENLAKAKRAIAEQQRAEEQAARARQAMIDRAAAQVQAGPRFADTVRDRRALEQQANRELAQLHQQMIQQYVTGDVRGFMESARRQVQIKQDALAKIRELEQKFSKDGGMLEQIKAGQSDKDKLAQVQNNRFMEAGRKLVDSSPERQKAMQDLLRQKGGAELTNEEQAAVNRLNREVNRLEARIKSQTRRDAKQGKIGEDEVSKAENDLTRKTIDAAEKSGQFGNETIAGLKQAVDAVQKSADLAIQNKKEIEKMREIVSQVSESLRGEINGGTSAAKRK